jgi:hypothetical protein
MSSTALGFAAWNSGASRAAGANGKSPHSRSTGDSDRVFLLCLSIVAGPSIFLIFNGIAVPLFVAMYASRPIQLIIFSLKRFFHRALANIKILSFSTSQVAFECVWTGIFTVLQIGRVQSLTLFLALCYVVVAESNLSRQQRQASMSR